jgi:DNA-binding transcriptional ArsR family regulator
MPYDYAHMHALGNPTRSHIFELVSARPRSVADLTRLVPVSQPAISQHLKVLREARLVRAEPQGASNIYHLDPQGLGEMRSWLDRMWTDALGSFGRAIEQSKEKSK